MCSVCSTGFRLSILIGIFYEIKDSCQLNVNEFGAKLTGICYPSLKEDSTVDVGLKLPSKIKVNLFKGETGVIIAELPDYDVSTEADSPLEIDYLVNDLIHVYFNIPEEYRKAIRYVPEELKKEITLRSHLVFQKFISDDAQRIFK